MLIKFLKHGKGSGKAAIDYLLGELDHKNEPRAGVKVLRGDPYLLADLIDSLDNVHRYTSGVIAFHPEDLPSDQDIEDVIDDFENVAFAGLEKNQYTYAVVQHIEVDGTKHLHFICPRIDLVSGKSLNVAPPGHEHYFKHWRDAWNEEKGWRSPADIELVRDPGTKELPEWKLTNFKKDVVQTFLVDNMKAGAFKDRQEMIDYLNRFGEVTRAGQDYIAFKAKGEAKAVRLKGVMFSEGWKYDPVNIETKKQPNPEKAEKHRQKLKSLYEKRAEYNKRKYKKKEDVIEPIQIEQDAIQVITNEEHENEQQATDRYTKSVIDAIERAAEINRIANEVNTIASEQIHVGFEIEDNERRIAEAEQAIARTKLEVERTESRIDANSGYIEKLRQGIEYFGSGFKALKDKAKSFLYKIQNLLKDDLAAALKAKKTEEIYENKPFLVEEIDAGKLALISFQAMSFEEQKELMIAALCKRGFSERSALYELEDAISSGVEEKLNEIVSYVTEDIVNEKNGNEEKGKVQEKTVDSKKDDDYEIPSL